MVTALQQAMITTHRWCSVLEDGMNASKKCSCDLEDAELTLAAARDEEIDKDICVVHSADMS